jgi:hypothetical protein
MTFTSNYYLWPCPHCQHENGIPNWAAGKHLLCRKCFRPFVAGQYARMKLDCTSTSQMRVMVYADSTSGAAV